MTPLKAPQVFTWDWKEQPPLDEIARALPEQPFMHQVADTGGDCYACVLSTWPLTQAEAQAAYDESVRPEEDDDDN